MVDWFQLRLFWEVLVHTHILPVVVCFIIVAAACGWAEERQNPKKEG